MIDSVSIIHIKAVIYNTKQLNMMKIMTKAIALIILLLISYSCVIGGIIGDGNIVKKQIEVSESFTSISVQQGIKVYLTQADLVNIEAEMDENILELLEVVVKNNKLSISFKKNVGKVTRKNIFLSCPTLTAIDVSSGAEVNSVNKFASVDLNLSASSGSDLDLNVSCQNMKISASSGADVDVKGTCDNLSVSASSGSDIEADKLICKTVVAKASSGSDIDVFASDSFEASASSGADIQCKGKPNNVSINKSSGGSVKIVK